MRFVIFMSIPCQFPKILFQFSAYVTIFNNTLVNFATETCSSVKLMSVCLKIVSILCIRYYSQGHIGEYQGFLAKVMVRVGMPLKIFESMSIEGVNS